MPASVFDPEAQAIFDSVNTVTTRQVRVDADTKTISVPFRSPEDWRDEWIYFLLVDRFNNPVNPPASTRLSSTDAVRRALRHLPRRHVRRCAAEARVYRGTRRWRHLVVASSEELPV